MAPSPNNDQPSAANSNVDADSKDEKGSGRSVEAAEPAPVRDEPDLDTAVALKKLDSTVVEKKELQTDPFGHLPAHEAEILRNQLDTPEVKVGYFTLYQHADAFDWMIFALACICAVIAGAAMPLMTVVFGNLTGMFADYFQGRSTYAQFQHTLSHVILYFVYLAIGEFVTVYIYVTGFIYVGGHCTQKLREQYLRAMLRQNIAIYDKLGSGEITTRITADTNAIQDGISEKFGLTLNAFATFIVAFVVAFIKSWKLTLILICGVFAIILVMGTAGSTMVSWTAEAHKEYAEGGTVAEEVISSVRNATAFNTQEKLARQYDTFLARAEKSGRKVQIMMGTMIAIMMCIVNLLYGLAFWEGSRLLVANDIKLSQLTTVAFAVIIGSFSLGNVAPNAKAFSSAVAAGVKIFAAIARKSPIDPDSDEGVRPDTLEGNIELKSIKHIYPSRPEVVVMEDVNLVIPAGKQTALVGASGSGKSTIVGLVERFYDPVGGEVLLDGRNLKDVNLRWLRERVSLVQQEPVLFSTTIFENIRYGLLGTKYQDLSKEKEGEMVIEAAKMANAHDFISNLPEGYETSVGDRGFLLSGGQKQRIAIARAVVSDPQILLLDEATSALDTKSEGVVQAALDNAAKGRTTIVIAHRLSTIKNADNIVVMSNGHIVEMGKHDDLLDRQGAYYNLVEAQRIAAASGATEGEEAVEETAELTKKVTTKSADGYVGDPDDVDPAKMMRTHTEKSQSSLVLEKKSTELQHKSYSMWSLIQLVWNFNKKEWYLALFGFMFSAIAGGGQPTQAVLFSKSISTLSLPPSQYPKLKHDMKFWSAMYLMLGLILLIANAGHAWLFGYCQELIIRRARLQAFRTILRQEVGYFDRKENTSGALTSFLSTSVTDLAGLTGSTLGTVLSVTTTMIAALTVALSIGWKLALVCISTIPVLIFCGYLRFSMLSRFQQQTQAAYQDSAAYACEAASAIRTVASLTREKDIYDEYHRQLLEQGQKGMKVAFESVLLFAASQSLVFPCIALGFWYGGTLIAKGEYTMFQFFVCFQSIVFGAQSAATIFSFSPDMGKAKHAAEVLKTLFERKPEIDSWSDEGEKVTEIEGHVEFRDVHFRYPTRPQQPVLRGLNLTVKPGQYAALVGHSGCGKSTTISLLERFYDPLAGGVFVDGKEISKLNLNAYRNHLSLVSQEPTLYQGTIRENVLLGADREDVPEEEVIKVCKDANIYDFIMSLP
jgi:ATP-binding cassette subfamily B (MDR/TAP) protein 1